MYVLHNAVSPGAVCISLPGVAEKSTNIREMLSLDSEALNGNVWLSLARVVGTGGDSVHPT